MCRVNEPVNGLSPAVFLPLKCRTCNYTAAACARSHELSTMADNQKNRRLAMQLNRVRPAGLKSVSVFLRKLVKDEHCRPDKRTCAASYKECF